MKKILMWAAGLYVGVCVVELIKGVANRKRTEGFSFVPTVVWDWLLPADPLPDPVPEEPAATDDTDLDETLATDTPAE